jgi:Transposase domain (DUF772)
MTRFVVGNDRSQSTLFPSEWMTIWARTIRFERKMFLSMSLIWPGWALAVLSRRRQEGQPTIRRRVEIYVYGYLNRVQSSRRLERECQRNIELVWLTGLLMSDFKTIADFREDNGEAIRKVCREFVVLCRRLELFSEAERCDRRQQVQGRQHTGSELHEHPFGTIKSWMGATHFQMKKLKHVGTEMAQATRA